MRTNRIAAALIAAVAAFAPGLYGQTAQKPSPYTGVSQPPPDDTITSDAAPSATPSAKPTTGPDASAAPSTGAPNAAAVPATAPPLAVAVPAQPNCNPDDRMIGDPSPCDAPPVPAQAVIQAKRAADLEADADIVTSVPTRPGELPEGTIIRMALDTDLKTGETQVGSDFSGKVSADVLSSGKVVIPQGSQVLGKVVQVTEGHRFGAPATIRIRPDLVVLPDGSRYVLRAQVLATSTKSQVDSEGTLKPASRMKTNVIQETAGMGAGAVTGALIGGGPGALVGTLVGAGVMTTHILVQHPALVNVPKDSTLTLSLTEPMLITPEVAANN